MVLSQGLQGKDAFDDNNNGYIFYLVFLSNIEKKLALAWAHTYKTIVYTKQSSLSSYNR